MRQMSWNKHYATNVMEQMLCDKCHGINVTEQMYCCGCKVYEQDSLMMDEHETWEMHRLNTIKQANNISSAWNKFLAAIKILNVENRYDFTQHLMYLQEEPNQNYVYTLL
jgi:hypothetical protein